MVTILGKLEEVKRAFCGDDPTTFLNIEDHLRSRLARSSLITTDNSKPHLFFFVLKNLVSATSSWIPNPSSSSVQATMPECFKAHYPKCRYIIDCTEAYGGRSSDTYITIDSGFLERIEPGDVVLADKGFPGINAPVESKHGVMVFPPFSKGQLQFTSAEMEMTYQVAKESSRERDSPELLPELELELLLELELELSELSESSLSHSRSTDARKSGPTVDAISHNSALPQICEKGSDVARCNRAPADFRRARPNSTERFRRSLTRSTELALPQICELKMANLIRIREVKMRAPKGAGFERTRSTR
ncbi:uncharacterized protein ISCGN_022709 [Ixodes scapularis]